MLCPGYFQLVEPCRDDREGSRRRTSGDRSSGSTALFTRSLATWRKAPHVCLHALPWRRHSGPLERPRGLRGPASRHPATPPVDRRLSAGVWRRNNHLRVAPGHSPRIAASRARPPRQGKLVDDEVPRSARHIACLAGQPALRTPTELPGVGHSVGVGVHFHHEWQAMLLVRTVMTWCASAAQRTCMR